MSYISQDIYLSSVENIDTRKWIPGQLCTKLEVELEIFVEL